MTKLEFDVMGEHGGCHAATVGMGSHTLTKAGRTLAKERALEG